MCACHAVRRVAVKFGGKSLADAKRIRRAAEAVAREVKEGVQVAVVVSAIGDTTDQLMQVAEKACRGNANPKDLDDILSMGERLSARIFSAALKSLGVKSRYFDPSNDDWPIITDDNFTDADPIVRECCPKIEKCILPLLDQSIVPVIPGFIGKTADGHVTTLGRGGSDTTAFILGGALKADEVILVTDVEGIFTADPKQVRMPRKLQFIETKRLAALSDQGAKFIHQKALKYKDPKINVRVISYVHDRLDAEGTVIAGDFPKTSIKLVNPDKIMKLTIISESLAKNNVFLNEIGELTADRGIKLHGVSTVDNSITIYISQNNAGNIPNLIHKKIACYKDDFALAIKKNLLAIKIEGIRLNETIRMLNKLLDFARANEVKIEGILPTSLGAILFIDSKSGEFVRNLLERLMGEINIEGAHPPISC